MSRLDNRAGVERHEHDPSLNKEFYELEEEVQRETYFENTNGILVVSGLPPVKSSKYAKFMKHLRKELAKNGVVWEDHVVDFYLPLGDKAEVIDEDDPPEGRKTHGLFFIELNNEQLASKLLNNLNGTSFSKSSTWCITSWSDWLATEDTDQEFVGPSFEDFQSSNSIRKWLEDPEGRDQFLVRSLDKIGEVDYHRCSVWWGDHRRNGGVLETNFESTLAKIGKVVLTDCEASWSPLGSYVTSRHEGRGVKTWCQERGDWVECKKFQHEGAVLFDWSPQETYLVTLAIADTKDGESAELQIWLAATGEPRRKLDATYHYQAGFKWPYLKWSNDDNYFAWIHTSRWKKTNERHTLGKGNADRFVVFSAETCRRLDSKAVDCPNIRLLSFSPGGRPRKENEENKPLISFGTKGSQDRPTNICLMEIPSKRCAVTSSHFDVFNADLLWHPNGRWLCAKIAKKKRKKKKKKTQMRSPEDQISSFDLTIFNCNHHNIPHDTISVGKNHITDFQWEPTRPRLCVLQKAELNEFVVRIFDFESMKSREVLHPSPKYLQVESVHWSPAGRHICLHHSPNGDRTFFDTETLKDKRQTHEGASEICWDPSGRFLVSSVVSDLGLVDEDYGAATDNGWVMYNFQGERIAQQDFKGGNGKARQCLFSFQWRPRPLSLLSEEHKADISKNLKKKYWEEFKKQDEDIFRRSASKKMKDRLDKQQAWKEIMEWLQESSEANTKERISIRDGRESEDEDDFEYEMIEEQEPISYVEVEVTVEELEQLS